MKKTAPNKPAPVEGKKSQKSKPTAEHKSSEAAREADFDSEMMFKADLMTRVFRAKGMDVYPGKIVVIRIGSSVMHPIEDAEFDHTKERIMGISLWGPFDKYQMGLASLDPINKSRFVAIISGEEFRPPLGVPLIDTCIARAKTFLVGKTTGRIISLGAQLPIPELHQFAAMREIERVLRDSTIKLLDAAPEDQRHALLALATILDIERPSPEILTAAIRELTASAPTWKRRQTIKSPTEQDRPSQRDLMDAVGCSYDTFRKVRGAAGIPKPKRGHLYSVKEVEMLIAAARKGNFNYKNKMIKAWAPWGSK